MPNHVINKVILLGKREDVEKLLDTIASVEKENGHPEYNIIDFNKIIPMPNVLRGMASPPRIVSEAEYKKEMELYEAKKKDPSLLTEEICNSYMKKYGAVDWYNWSCAHWGTKWNAYSQFKDEILETNSGNVQTAIIFDTAWSTPYPVIEKLHEMFPSVKIELRYADEDASSNTGVIKFNENGTQIYNPEDGSDEAWELYLELHPDMKGEFVKNKKGEYVYKEDLEDNDE
jgi:hypothetical protein